jgi:hypothetical protein
MKACALVESVECEGLGDVAEGRLSVGIGRRHCEIVYERSEGWERTCAREGLIVAAYGNEEVPERLC